MPDDTLPYKQVLEGVDYVNSAGPYGPAVMIYGGGATAAWVATEAMGRAQKVLWIARPGGTGFTGGVLPGNRNAKVLLETEALRQVGTLTNVTYCAKYGSRDAMLMIKVDMEDGNKKTYFVHQLVYSLGGDPKAEGSISRIVNDALLNALAPIVDSDRVISDGSGILAWGDA